MHPENQSCYLKCVCVYIFVCVCGGGGGGGGIIAHMKQVKLLKD